MFYSEDIITTVIEKHPCCAVWTVPVNDLAAREKNYFSGLAPTDRTAVVPGHHVMSRAEWTWYAGERGTEYCAADTHTDKVCTALKQTFESQDYSSVIAPYPGRSGLQFRYVALAAGAGRTGVAAHPLLFIALQ